MTKHHEEHTPLWLMGLAFSVWFVFVIAMSAGVRNAVTWSGLIASWLLFVYWFMTEPIFEAPE